MASPAEQNADWLPSVPAILQQMDTSRDPFGRRAVAIPQRTLMDLLINEPGAFIAIHSAWPDVLNGPLNIEQDAHSPVPDMDPATLDFLADQFQKEYPEAWRIALEMGQEDLPLPDHMDAQDEHSLSPNPNAAMDTEAPVSQSPMQTNAEAFDSEGGIQPSPFDRPPYAEEENMDESSSSDLPDSEEDIFADIPMPKDDSEDRDYVFEPEAREENMDDYSSLGLSDPDFADLPVPTPKSRASKKMAAKRAP